MRFGCLHSAKPGHCAVGPLKCKYLDGMAGRKAVTMTHTNLNAPLAGAVSFGESGLSRQVRLALRLIEQRKAPLPDFPARI